MKKIAILVITLALLAACTPQEKTAEELSVEISKTKAKVNDLNAKLVDMEAQLAVLQEETPEMGLKVNVEFLETQTFASYIKTSATVEAVNAAMVSPEMNGKILKIHVKEGQKVRRRQLLVTLDADILKRGLAEMDKGLELTKTLFDKQKDLYDQGVGSEMQFLEVKNRYESMQKSRETLSSQINMAKIHAPFSGYIETIFQKVGELATPGRQVVQLINLENLYINTELSESYLSSVQTGDTTWVTFPNIPEMEKIATITQTGKMINLNSRTFSIRVDMHNEGELLKPNMLAQLKIRDYLNHEALLVPTILVRQDPKGSFIYLVRQHDGDSFAVKTYVKTGRSDGTRSLITSGLEAGDIIITNGYNLVKDGNKVEIIN
ncbi:MAG: efflux RND transporter periplasmic adaptor subunit [Bacteroidota bacterium]|nr:efflux RND transporter periplasmic adaptor subunit [Bacteroidota bacterium]